MPSTLSCSLAGPLAAEVKTLGWATVLSPDCQTEALAGLAPAPFCGAERGQRPASLRQSAGKCPGLVNRYNPPAR